MHTSAVPSAPSRWLDIKSGIVILDVLLLCAMLAWLPFDPMVNKGLGILVFIAILWLTEALHVTITALLVPLLWLSKAIDQGLGDGDDPVTQLVIFHTLFNALGVVLMGLLSRWLVPFLLSRFASTDPENLRPPTRHRDLHRPIHTDINKTAKQ
jgi:di/tricarboxylate transporter